MNWPTADPRTTVQRLFVQGLHFLRRKILKPTRRAAQADQGCVAARAAIAFETARPISCARCELAAMRPGWEPLFFLPEPGSPVGPNVINKSCVRVRLALRSGVPP